MENTEGVNFSKPVKSENSLPPIDFEGKFQLFHDELAETEKKVAGEIDPGARAVFVAALVLVICFSLVLPHSGSASGFDVLTHSPEVRTENIGIGSYLFVWLTAVFGVVASALALTTRRWVLAFTALAGSAVGCVAGMLAWWSRNTENVDTLKVPEHGPGIGLIIGWFAMLVITFHWSRTVWARNATQFAAEQARRNDSYRHEDDIQTIIRGALDN